MASGGSRGNAGRPQDPSSLNASMGKHDDSWTTLQLPSGEVPEWPLEGFLEREQFWWGRLWQRPQASKWAELMLDDSVALYVRYLIEAEQPGATSNIRNLVKQYQELLGLSTSGLKAQKWVLPGETAPSAASSVVKKKASSARGRLKVVRDDE